MLERGPILSSSLLNQAKLEETLTLFRIGDVLGGLLSHNEAFLPLVYALCPLRYSTDLPPRLN